MNSKNILILDSQPLVCEALKNIINIHFPETEVHHTGCSHQGVQLIANHPIDIVVLDVDLLNSNGFDFVRRIRAKNYHGKILFITTDTHSVLVKAAKKVGANGFISKNETTEHIKDAIAAVSRGFSVFRECKGTERKTVELSNRESIVYNYLVKGYTNQKISKLLSLSAKTISTYKTRILDKYNAESIIEVMRLQNVLTETPSQYPPHSVVL